MFGDAAPDLWVAIARAAWLAVPVLAWRLAARVEGGGRTDGAIAGAVAAVATLLLADEITSWVRQGAGALSEPLLVALVLGAVEAALGGRVRLALALGFAACLLRPEAWPFAALYAWRTVRSGEVSPHALAFGAVAVAGLWFVPDLVGAGNALEGAGRARGADNSPLEVLGWAAEMPLAVLWLGVAMAVVPWRGRLPRPAAALVAGSAAWIFLVAVMAGAGYAGLPRFMAPPAAVLCAVGAAGLVRGLRSLRPRLAAVAVVIAVVALGAQAAARAADLPGQLERVRDDSAVIKRLGELAEANPEAFLGCGELWTSDFLAHTTLAWHLDVALGDIVTTGTVAPADGRLVVGPRSDPTAASRARATGAPIAADGPWEVSGTGRCMDQPAGAAAASGARR
jgi:hypothetical protein